MSTPYSQWAWSRASEVLHNAEGSLYGYKVALAKMIDRIRPYMPFNDHLAAPKWKLGDRVRKKSGSEWEGYVVGYYRTKLNPRGYCVESATHAGSVQIYPEKALEAVE